MTSFWGDCPRCGPASCRCPEPVECIGCQAYLSAAEENEGNPPLCDGCRPHWCDDCGELHELGAHIPQETHA